VGGAARWPHGLCRADVQNHRHGNEPGLHRTWGQRPGGGHIRPGTDGRARHAAIHHERQRSGHQAQGLSLRRGQRAKGTGPQIYGQERQHAGHERHP